MGDQLARARRRARPLGLAVELERRSPRRTRRAPESQPRARDRWAGPGSGRRGPPGGRRAGGRGGAPSRSPRSIRSGSVRRPRSASQASIVPGTAPERPRALRERVRRARGRARRRLRAAGRSGRRCTWSRCGGRGRRPSSSGRSRHRRGEGRVDDAQRRPALARRGSDPVQLGHVEPGLEIASSQSMSASRLAAITARRSRRIDLLELDQPGARALGEQLAHLDVGASGDDAPARPARSESTTAAAAAIPEAKATASPPSSTPSACSNALQVGLPSRRSRVGRRRAKAEANTGGWLSGAPGRRGRPATTAIVAGSSAAIGSSASVAIHRRQR